MDFKIGDYVDEPSLNLTVYGKILSLTELKAKVSFQIPNREKEKGFCDSCKSSAHLSISGNTGELVCMVTGCGHEHGFKETKKTIPLSKLINITSQRAEKKKQEAAEKK